MNIFQVLLIQPITNLLIIFYQLFAVLKVPGALGWSIVALTSVIRLAISPLMKQQVDQSKKVQELQPILTKLQKKYKNDPKKLQQVQMELYKEKNINPGAGCLIFIIQIPLFLGLYSALSQTLITAKGIGQAIAHINSLLYFPALHIKSLDLTFFGLQLDKMPSQWQNIGWWYLLIPVVTGGLQLYQSYLTTKTMQPIQTNPKLETRNSKQIQNPKSENKETKKSDEPDFNSIMQKEMLFLFPVMIGWAAMNFPVGMAIYWNIFTLFGIIQYLPKKVKS